MSAPADEVVIDGLRYRRVDRVATRVSAHVMYDCHLFRLLKGTSVDGLIADWEAECVTPDKRYGGPFLCPVIVLDGERELRRVGTMVFPDSPKTSKDLAEWRRLCLADPDIERLLGSVSESEVTK